MMWFLILWSGWWSSPAANVSSPVGSTPLISGITISCQGSGRIWGTDAFARELDGLPTIGANAIATHPYGRIHGDGRVTWRWRDGRAPGSVTRPVREAKARNLMMMMKPHLAYWGSPFSWRGAIRFDDPADRARFFASYGDWMVAIAKATTEADIFVVGTELKGLTQYEAEWRELIGRIRAVTKARLTFAANWDAYQKIEFWDALDLIGIQAYFPLTQSKNPDEAVLRQAWTGIMTELERYGKKYNRQILFTELGYNRSTKAASEPWDYRQEPSEAALALQKRCLKVALEVARERHPHVAGVFLWKWFVGAAPFENFYLNAGELPEVISSAWCQPLSD